MISHLHLAHNLDKQLDRLLSHGHKEEMAAKRCRQLLDTISEHGYQMESVYNKRTKNGEQRMRNCIKYDLGSGYRLITVRRDGHLFIPFFGSHDEVDQWMARNRFNNFLPDASTYKALAVNWDSWEEGCEDELDCDTCELDDTALTADPYETDLLNRLDPLILQDIFCGLYQQPAASAPSPRAQSRG